LDGWFPCGLLASSSAHNRFYSMGVRANRNACFLIFTGAEDTAIICAAAQPVRGVRYCFRIVRCGLLCMDPTAEKHATTWARITNRWTRVPRYRDVSQLI